MKNRNIELHRTLSTRFSEDELQDLAFYLEVDYEDLSPGGKSSKARELIAYMERYGRLPDLIRMGQQLRPDVNWTQFVSKTATAVVPTEQPLTRPTSLSPALSRLKRLLDRQELVLFVGTDFPLGVTGVPSPAELAQALASDFQLPTGYSLPRTASLIDRFSLIKTLQEQLNGRQSSGLYSQMAAFAAHFNLDTIVTTAWDDHLKQALAQQGELNWLLTDSHLQLARRQWPHLIQLYGHIDNPDSLVLTNQDQNALQRQVSKPLLLQKIRSELNQRGLLALGQDLADITFLNLLDSVAGQSFQAPSFAIWPLAAPAEQEAMARLRNLTVIVGEVPDILQVLSQ